MAARLSFMISILALVGCEGEPASKAPPDPAPVITPAPTPTAPEDPVDVEGKKLLAIGQRIVDVSKSADCATFMGAVNDLTNGSPATVSAELAARVMKKYGPELQRLLESTTPMIAKCRNDPTWIAAMKKNADTWGRRMVGISERVAREAVAAGGDCASFGRAVEPIVPELTVLRGQPPTGDEVKPQLDDYAARSARALAPARPLLTQCAADATVQALVPLL
ncbi:MAG TPA: hypothetical protein VMZ28_18445 [Kofleriaceae bacterium]|nr:hypothetical protein [Kofleriaceae bacterium]